MINTNSPSNHVDAPRADLLLSSQGQTVSNLSSKNRLDPFKFLSSLNEFSQVPASEIRALADSSRFAQLDSGQYITNEGDEESSRAFIVVSGVLAMIKNSSSGKELIVELLLPGDIFDLLLTLAAEKLPAQLSARSVQESTVLWVPTKQFAHLLKTHDSLFKNFAAHLLLCLQSSYNLSRGLAHDRVEVRIAAILLSLAIKFSKSTNAGQVCTIHFTRQQIADLTGTTPETAIRVTRAMQREGVIDISRPGVIRIVNLQALSEIVEA